MTKLSKQAALIYVKGVGQFTQEQIHDYLLKCVKEFPTNYNGLIADAESVYALLFKNGVFRANLEAIIGYSILNPEELDLMQQLDHDDLKYVHDYFYEIDKVIELKQYCYLLDILYKHDALEYKLWQFITDNADEINHYQAEAYADESADRKRKDC